MGEQEKLKYFDELASRWDGFTDHNRVRASLRVELDRMHLLPDEHVVDLGCGTGNLTAVLLVDSGPGQSSPRWISLRRWWKPPVRSCPTRESDGAWRRLPRYLCSPEVVIGLSAFLRGLTSLPRTPSF